MPLIHNLVRPPASRRGPPLPLEERRAHEFRLRRQLAGGVGRWISDRLAAGVKLRKRLGGAFGDAVIDRAQVVEAAGLRP